MNWLAHLYLSEPDAAFRLGNLLPDLVRAGTLASLPAPFQRGIRQHRRIDAFTDAHPVVRRSIGRIHPPFRRFGGVLTDVFYDHFLACDWRSYSAEELSDFTRGVYDSFERFYAYLPDDVCARLQQMQSEDWLCSYRGISGVAAALERIALQLRHPVDLAASVSVLEQSCDLFHADFRVFFPELQSHVSHPSDASESA